MRLYHSPTSPYVRKVMVTAIECGLDRRLDLVSTMVPPTQPNQDLSRDNPLAKLPTLITDDGEVLYDSRVICEYLDSLNPGPKLIPPAGSERWRVLRWQAMADGISDAGLLCRYEASLRPENKRSAEWVAGQTTKVNQGLDSAEADGGLLSAPVNLGQIALACAIGRLEFAGDKIRDGRPKLFAWYDAFARRPSMQATTPKAR